MTHFTQHDSKTTDVTWSPLEVPNVMLLQLYMYAQSLPNQTFGPCKQQTTNNTDKAGSNCDGLCCYALLMVFHLLVFLISCARCVAAALHGSSGGKGSEPQRSYEKPTQEQYIPDLC
jgi:hypothetical protein